MIRFYNELAKFETNLKTAKESGYTRNILVRDRKRLYEIHNELTGKNRLFNAACTKCTIEVLTELAKRYFEFKENGIAQVTDDEAPDVRQVFTDQVPDAVQTVLEKPKKPRKPRAKKEDGKISGK